MFVGEKEASVLSNNWVIVFGSFPFLFPFLSSSFFLPDSCLVVDLSKFEKCWKQDCRTTLVGRVSTGVSFLPGTVGVRGSSRSVRAKGSALGAEITMTRHKA